MEVHRVFWQINPLKTDSAIILYKIKRTDWSYELQMVIILILRIAPEVLLCYCALQFVIQIGLPNAIRHLEHIDRS